MDMSETNLNEMNFVNFSTDLTNQLDPDGGLLSLPFDNIYGCDSENPSRSAKYPLEEELRNPPRIIKIKGDPTDDVRNIKIFRELKLRKKLQHLILCNLDLIQYQSEQIIIKDKMYEALHQENEMLKNRLKVLQEMIAQNQSNVNPPPLVHMIQKRPSNVPSEDGDFAQMPDYVYNEEPPYIATESYRVKANTGKKNNLKRTLYSKKRVVNGKSRRRHAKSKRLMVKYRDCEEDFDDEEEKFLSSLSRRRRKFSDNAASNECNEEKFGMISDVKVELEETAVEYQAVKEEPFLDSENDLNVVKIENP